jgi:hypothetical protein
MSTEILAAIMTPVVIFSILIIATIKDKRN